MAFLQGWIWWAVAVVYAYLNNFVFKGPFGLMLHCTSHRPFFKKKYQFINYYLPWVIAPFFGHSPETYFAHHIGMHHAEEAFLIFFNISPEKKENAFSIVHCPPNYCFLCFAFQ